MGITKKYTYDYEDYDKSKGASTMVEDILSLGEICHEGLESLTIICWKSSTDYSQGF